MTWAATSHGKVDYQPKGSSQTAKWLGYSRIPNQFYTLKVNVEQLFTIGELNCAQRQSLRDVEAGEIEKPG